VYRVRLPVADFASLDFPRVMPMTCGRGKAAGVGNPPVGSRSGRECPEPAGGDSKTLVAAVKPSLL